MDLRILADDLTGALDTAAAFAGEVPVWFDEPPTGTAVTPVAAVATATRDLPPDALPEALAPCVDWLAGADIAFKKIDSLLRGNTMAEVIHLARAGRFDRILFAPAFPQQGRLTLGGRLVLASAGQAPSAGPTMQEALASAGMTVEVPDVRDGDELRRLAARVTGMAGERWLWCGSAGLAHALAQALGQAPRAAPRLAGVGHAPVLLVSASHHAVVRRQWQRLAEALPAGQVQRQADALSIAAALAELRGPPARLCMDISASAPLSPEEAATRLQEQVQQIVKGSPRPGVLIVIGGDTLRALCRSSQARGLSACASTRIGWGQARWIGGPWDGVPCHARSGAFGGDEDLIAVLQTLGGR